MGAKWDLTKDLFRLLFRSGKAEFAKDAAALGKGAVAQAVEKAAPYNPGWIRRGAGAIGGGFSKAATTATFAPVALLGYPVLKTGELALSGAWSAAKGIGKHAWHTGGKMITSPGGRMQLAAAGAILGTGMMARHSLSAGAENVRKRDPANTMGLTLNQHNMYR